MKEQLVAKPFQKFTNSEWDKLLDDFNATVNYTSWFIDYLEVLNTQTQIKNFTFTLIDNTKVVAIVPLYIEKISNRWQMSTGQEPIFAPIFSKNISNDRVLDYYQFIIEQIDDTANKHKCILARFQYSPLLHTKFSRNYFVELGYKKHILHPDWYMFKASNSYVIDLKQPKDQLFKKIRKGHRANINRTKKIAKLIILDASTFDQKIFKQYIELFYQVKGNKRTKEAFAQDLNAIKFGHEIVMICEYNELLVGAIAIHIHNKKARYNSSIQLYGLSKDLYPNHFLLSSAISYLKDREFELFEIGEQVQESNLYKVSKKEKNLSHFKSGWGGDLHPCMKAQREFMHV